MTPAVKHEGHAPGLPPCPLLTRGNLTTALLFTQLNAIQRRLPGAGTGKAVRPQRNQFHLLHFEPDIREETEEDEVGDFCGRSLPAALRTDSEAPHASTIHPVSWARAQSQCSPQGVQ